MELLPVGITGTIVGFFLVGLGCAPVYPCLIHSTPERFGAGVSQAVIGVQMASAYVGSTLMPPIFGFIADNISISLLPAYLVILLIVMIIVSQRLNKIT